MHSNTSDGLERFVCPTKKYLEPDSGSKGLTTKWNVVYLIEKGNISDADVLFCLNNVWEPGSPQIPLLSLGMTLSRLPNSSVSEREPFMSNEFGDGLRWGNCGWESNICSIIYLVIPELYWGNPDHTRLTLSEIPNKSMARTTANIFSLAKGGLNSPFESALLLWRYHRTRTFANCCRFL